MVVTELQPKVIEERKQTLIDKENERRKRTFEKIEGNVIIQLPQSSLSNNHNENKEDVQHSNLPVEDTKTQIILLAVSIF